MKVQIEITEMLQNCGYPIGAGQRDYLDYLDFQDLLDYLAHGPFGLKFGMMGPYWGYIKKITLI